MAVLGLFGGMTGLLRAQVSETGSTASFRGLGVAADGTIWVSGTGGTVLRSTDGGAHWNARPITDAQSFDLRDIEAVSATTAYAMVAGNDTARIYKTTDGGQHWERQYNDTRPGIFLDGIAFWDEQHGIAMGDPMEGRLVVLRTEDGGAHWTQLATAAAPLAQQGEAGFAASGTAITVGADGRAWIGTGGSAGAGRVFRSADFGRTWQVSETPIPAGASSRGIFSLAFADFLHGVAVGGDYSDPQARRPNVAITKDGGKTWERGDTTTATDYLSAVAYMDAEPLQLVAVGTAGMFTSSDGGKTWSRINTDSYNAVTAGKRVVAAGEGGHVAIWPSLDAAKSQP